MCNWDFFRQLPTAQKKKELRTTSPIHCLINVLLTLALYRCEPFDTYPRTYDLLHAFGLFSNEYKR